jgi:hypothetical protein
MALDRVGNYDSSLIIDTTWRTQDGPAHPVAARKS